MTNNNFRQSTIIHRFGNQFFSRRSSEIRDAAAGDASNLVGKVISSLALALLLGTTNGCLATRSWVNDQISPVNAKADRALVGLQSLKLERRLVLDSEHGPTFATGSSNLTTDAKHQIDGFLRDIEGPAGSASGRLFVIAGHTDSVGGEDLNYALGQRRADRVAGYLVSKDRVDPTQIRVISYGASKPLADNSTSSGRRSNRRVEILVYQETISTGS